MSAQISASAVYSPNSHSPGAGDEGVWDDAEVAEVGLELGRELGAGGEEEGRGEAEEEGAEPRQGQGRVGDPHHRPPSHAGEAGPDQLGIHQGSIHKTFAVSQRDAAGKNKW